jgi:hypothetical protein
MIQCGDDYKNLRNRTNCYYGSENGRTIVIVKEHYPASCGHVWNVTPAEGEEQIAELFGAI